MLAQLIIMAGDTADIAPNTVGGAQYLSMVIALFIPLLVGLITTHWTSPKVKSLVNIGASVVTGFLTEWVTALNDAQHFMWQQALIGSIIALVTSLSALYGFYYPTGVDTKLKNVGSNRKRAA